MLAIEYSKIKNQIINKQHQNLTQIILDEKNKIDHWQQTLNDTENYKTQGTIIRSKERLIVNEENPTKYFYQQEK